MSNFVSRRHLSLLGLGFTALCLTSCGGIPTQWAPNGYRYETPEPLSSPPPTRPWLDEADHPNLENIGDSTAAWQGAIYELINPLPQIVLPSSGPLTLKTTPPAYPADTAMDHYLRQGLLSYGYTVNPTPDNKGTVLVYNAAPLSNPDNVKKAQAKFGKEFVKKGDMKGMYYLTLDVIGTNGKVITSQASIGVFPHDKSEYSRWPGFSYQPVQGRADKKPVYETRD